jgi:Ala-tRNA(Pro) deacylase
MATHKLTNFLDDNHVIYDVIHHAPTYTARQTAESAHISARELAKTVIVKADERLAMAVTSARDTVDMKRLGRAIGARQVTLATEKDFVDRFPECEVGAMPPFGNLYGLEVFVSPHLLEDEQICFNAGSHRELMKMAYRDFERLVQPVPAAF